MRRTLVWTVAVLALASVSLATEVPRLVPAGADVSLAVVGDLRRTGWFERLTLHEQNDAERTRLLKNIAEENADALILLGDMVTNGSASADWKYFDEITEPVHETGIPFLPVLGNHDCGAADSKAFVNLTERFPHLRESTWYARRLGSLGLVWLNSNFDELGHDGCNGQVAWFRNILESMDSAADVRGVLVFVHHAPYSDSTGGRESARVRSAFVPIFTAARKTLAMITGHAHTYEHLQVDGKDFIVSGGGGGPRVKVRAAEDRQYTNLYDGPPLRPFHYLLMRSQEDGVTVRVKGFDKGEPELRVIDRFVLPFPAPANAS